MVPAHFYDVTLDKIKSNLIKNIAGLHYHSLIDKLLFKSYNNLSRTRESSSDFGHVQNYQIGRSP